jgi:hypothetical protein
LPGDCLDACAEVVYRCVHLPEQGGRLIVSEFPRPVVNAGVIEVAERIQEFLKRFGGFRGLCCELLGWVLGHQAGPFLGVIRGAAQLRGAGRVCGVPLPGSFCRSGVFTALLLSRRPLR